MPILARYAQLRSPGVGGRHMLRSPQTQQAGLIFTLRSSPRGVGGTAGLQSHSRPPGSEVPPIEFLPELGASSNVTTAELSRA